VAIILTTKELKISKGKKVFNRKERKGLR